MKGILASSTRGVQVYVIFSIIASILGAYFYGFTSSEALLVLTGYFMYGCLGVVVTFHRGLTHRSYKTYGWLQKIFSIFGCLGGTGSSLAWVAIHINHHRKSDTPGDPHSPVYKGWRMFLLDYVNEVDTNTKWKMKRLVTDRFHQFLHRYYFAILLSWDILLYIVGGMYLVIFLHLMPLVVTGIMSNVVNYISHKPNWLGGFRTYNLKDQSANNWLMAIPTWGEAWHNNHHRYPGKYSCGEKWWQLDISALVIRIIKV